MKRTLALSVFVASSLAAGAAFADTLTVSDDGFLCVSGGTGTCNAGYGMLYDPFLPVYSRPSKGENNTHAIIEFADPAQREIVAASLRFHFERLWTASLPSATFYVWGVKDDGPCYEDITGPSGTPLLPLTTQFPFFDNSGDGVDSTSPCLYDANPAVAGAQRLGTFTVGQGEDLTVDFSSPALTSFVQSDTDGVITIALTTKKETTDVRAEIVAEDHSTKPAAQLHVQRVGQLTISSFLGDLTQNPDGSWHFDGDLSIPVGQGQEVVVPGADVDMTFNADGELQTISGTVGFPELPGTGMLDDLGPFSSTGPSLQIGYDYPAAFNSLGLPLDAATRYFYFLEQSGASVTWGQLSAEAPGTGATMLALDPDAPTVFFYTDQLLPDSPVTAVSVGVSGGNTIPFQPWYEEYVESQMVTFKGDLYLGGEVSIPTSIPAVTVDVTGDMTVNVHDSAFVSGGSLPWIKDLGVNGEVSLGAGLGPFSMSCYLGGATLLYRDSTYNTLTFSGLIEPDQIDGLPFVPKGSIVAAGHLSQDLSKSFLILDGDMEFPGSFPMQKINAYAYLDKNGGELDGTAKFAGTTFHVQGAVYSSYAAFSGSISHNFNAYIGKVKATITASFDSRNTSVGLSAKVQFCVKDPFSGNEECDSIGGSVSVNGGGNIRLCANIPGYGTECDTLG